VFNEHSDEKKVGREIYKDINNSKHEKIGSIEGA
jgi:hypothetical protein